MTGRGPGLSLAPDEALRVQMAVVLLLGLGGAGAALQRWPAVVVEPSPSCGSRPVPSSAGVLACGPSSDGVDPVRALLLGRPLDLATADARALAAVPGIGPRMAARIIEDRAARGPFRSVEDLERVRGIGPALRRRIAAYAEPARVPDSDVRPRP